MGHSVVLFPRPASLTMTALWTEGGFLQDLANNYCIDLTKREEAILMRFSARGQRVQLHEPFW